MMILLDFFFLEDKQKHIMISLLLLIMIFLIRWLLKLHKTNYNTLSYAIRDTILIGLCKELIDLFGFGNPQITDLFADSIGIFLPLYAYMLIKNANKIKGNDFFMYEGDFARYTFHNLYKIYFDFKNDFKLIFKKYILRDTSISSRKLKNELELLKNEIKFGKKILKYFFLMQCIWCIDFIKFLLKLPIITFFGTFGLVFSPVLIYSNDGQNNKIS